MSVLAELKSETRVLRKSKEVFETRTAELENHLDRKQIEIVSLHETIDRLQKEKRQLLVELNHIQAVSTASGMSAVVVCAYEI